MVIMTDCKKKLASFRVKELKDVLGQLGLPKHGRKQDLVDRVLVLLSSEEASDEHGSGKKKIIEKEQVAKVIDDAYRKRQDTGATDSASGGPGASDTSSILPKEVRCPCGSSLSTEFMIQCADPKCQVSQHILCVIMPEESIEGVPPVPSQFYCELCRISRSDPFWVTVAQPLSPVKLLVSDIPIDGSSPLQTVETEFEITRAHYYLMDRPDHDVQVWCVLLNDSVPFRMQWPQYADLKINGSTVKTASRPGSQKLGANGRDEGPAISLYVAEGFNKISFSGRDSRSFCVGIRIVKRRTIQQVIDLIPSEQDGEPVADALARVCRCIGGGMAKTNEDSDSDLEVIADCVTVNLRCPMSGSRIKTASRFKTCGHLGCFDLETFVQLNQKSRKWQCPICLKNYTLEDIIIDPYFNRITNLMRDYEEDKTEIEVKPNGCWRAKSGRPSVNLQQWHLPDGSVCPSTVESNMDGIAKQNNPLSATRVNGDLQTQSSGNQRDEYFEHYDQEIITMSSSASESGKDDRPQSINQQRTGHFVFTAIIDDEMSSMPYNIDQKSGIMNKSSSASFGDPNLIVLSDSDEEHGNLVSPRTVSISCPPNDSGSSVSANPGIPCSNMDGPLLGAAPLFPNMDVEAGSNHTSNGKRSRGPFIFPRQPRSMRRLHAPVDSDRE